jgi:hypothetical protein
VIRDSFLLAPLLENLPLAFPLTWHDTPDEPQALFLAFPNFTSFQEYQELNRRVVDTGNEILKKSL